MTNTTWLDKPVVGIRLLSRESVILILILLAAVITRFYLLDVRVMSHDESLHTYFSWKMYKEGTYVHDPMMHGTFQFHVVSLAYYLLGDSDFSARVPVVIFGIVSVAMVWAFRRYLGTTGTLISASMMVISPYMLYYSRYVRNESYVVLFVLVGLWAILRYLETGKSKYLLWLTISTALHFTTKETSFIAAAQMLLYLGLLFLTNILRQPWKKPQFKYIFLITLILAGLFIGFALYETMFSGRAGPSDATGVVAPAVPGQAVLDSDTVAPPSWMILVPAIAGGLAGVAAILCLLIGFGGRRLAQNRAFELLLLLATMVLPQLSPFPVRYMGWNVPDTPGAIQAMTALDVTHFLVFIIPLVAIAIVLGLWWNVRLWLINAAAFWGIFIFFYTTMFTNPNGIISGLAGSLGYWMAQQTVQRGSQPWYYYPLLQLPIYEFLAIGGSLTALWAIIYKQMKQEKVEAAERPEVEMAIEYANGPVAEESELLAVAEENAGEDEVGDTVGAGTLEKMAVNLLVFWAVSSLIAYSIAGEKMPWLTVHITLPMILLGGWGIGQLIEAINWEEWKKRGGWVMLSVVVVFLGSAGAVVGGLLGTHPPFQSKELVDLQASARFTGSLLILAGSGYGLYRLAKTWSWAEMGRVGALLVLGMGAVLSARTAFQASYVNYDQANEYLVYAHSARGVKDVLEAVNEISKRTTDGLALGVAYDDDTSWPMTWYMRNFRNHRYYANQPGKDLRDLPVIIVGDNNYGKIEPVVGQAYYMIEYIRMVWPNQDYFNLTWERIKEVFTNAELRAGLFQIWLNRDFTLYSQATGQNIRLDEWNPADRMRMYVRKDVASKLWEYATGPVEEETIADPYEGGGVEISPDVVLGQAGSEAGQFSRPRGVAVAADGTLYIADTENNRIQHLGQDGTVLHTWGSFGDILAGETPGGTFNQPWDVAVGPDGSVFVADTWNHRIQKFTADGQFLSMWGYFGQAETPDGFWGPRSVAVDATGRVYISDTGNKRIAIFDSNGQFVSQFGSFGLEPGTFDEPVGLALDASGNVYVADTWNQRVQVFTEVEGQFNVLRTWDVAGWYGQSLDNKPYLDVDENGNVFATDPEGARVIQFDHNGNFVRYWGTGVDGFLLVGGISSDGQGGVWATDAGSGRILHYTLP